MESHNSNKNKYIDPDILALINKLQINSNKTLSALIILCSIIMILVLTILAIRAVVRLEPRWDTVAYHLPFSALRGGLGVPYVMNETMQNRFQGFPFLPHLLQGILWRITGSINATGVVNYLAFVLFIGYCHVVLRAGFWLVAMISLTAPLVLIHTTVSYVDLFGNSLLAIGLSSCLYIYLFPERSQRIVLLCGLGGLIGAAWSKYLLVPVVGLVWCLFVLVCLVARRPAMVRRRQTLLLLLAVLFLISAPYIKNFVEYKNPFWPIHVPVMTKMFPASERSDSPSNIRPAALNDLSPFMLFTHSILEINHPDHYDKRPRWIIDQGNADIAFRMGGFWNVGVVIYLSISVSMLLVYWRKAGIIPAICLVGILSFVAILPQSHELRYYLFIPLCWAAAIGMMFDRVKKKTPLVAISLLMISMVLFGYMVSENRVHYRIENIGYEKIAQVWKADTWWPKFRQGETYCAVGMVPMSFLLTGPTMHEFTIIDRSNEESCPSGSIVVTKDNVMHRKGEIDAKASKIESLENVSEQDYVNESMGLYSAGKYKECIIACLKALKLKPDCDLAYNNICSANNAMGQYDKAIKACEKAIKINPDFQLAKNNLAWAMQMKNAQKQ